MQYRFHKEGKATLLWVSLTGTFFCLLFYYLGWKTGAVVCAGVFLFLLIIVLQFFRNPPRKFQESPDFLLAPADGKVVVIEEVFEPEHLKKQVIQVSIFMSPFNVHINRYPGNGTVSYFAYHPGKYLVAWHPKSSTENERTSMAMKVEGFGEILLRQIAGALARRIVWYPKPGDIARQSDEFGFIKFGSRVDIFLPLGTEILVKPGDITRGGLSPIAKATVK